ncbi:hypothetical protein [Bifidobacterium sp. ESL0704]|uniref:hypothetical protein n=1 Tax=Bifidobacterium sp. ESL0704 TaxID=2983219 RepID=UPI0023F75BEE|nr:hypothetical protein [Bifidobacterium sp. ESL0704]WEV53507.1 hypothetical protein OZX64_03315 [Bifidobacterium sp. ESL0704]
MTSESDYRWTEASPDYRARLQNFACAAPLGGFALKAVRKHNEYYAEYEYEVQATIRDMRSWDRRSQWVDICVSREKQERIWSFVWFGIVGGTKKDSMGTYMVGYIARALDAKGCHFGDSTLKHALSVMQRNQEKTGRDAVIGARVDPDNKSSMALFKRHGFADTGQDPEALEYHRLMRFGFDES